MEPIGESGGRADQLNMYNVIDRRSRLREQGVRSGSSRRSGSGYAHGQKYLGTGRVVVEVTPGKKLVDRARRACREAASRARKGGQPNSQHCCEAGVAIAAEEATGRFDRSIMPSRPGSRNSNCRRYIAAGSPTAWKCCWWKNTKLPMVNIHVVFPVGRYQ